MGETVYVNAIPFAFFTGGYIVETIHSKLLQHLAHKIHTLHLATKEL